MTGSLSGLSVTATHKNVAYLALQDADKSVENAEVDAGKAFVPKLPRRAYMAVKLDLKLVRVLDPDFLAVPLDC